MSRDIKKLVTVMLLPVAAIVMLTLVLFISNPQSTDRQFSYQPPTSSHKNFPGTQQLNAKLKIMFETMLKASNIRQQNPSLKVLVTLRPGSYTNGANVFIAKTDIQLCAFNIDCVAMIVAHEIGHNALGHFGDTGNRSSVQLEADADRYSISLLKREGSYRCTAGTIFFKNIIRIMGDGGGRTHPKSSDRIKAIEQQCAK